MAPGRPRRRRHLTPRRGRRWPPCCRLIAGGAGRLRARWSGPGAGRPPPRWRAGCGVAGRGGPPWPAAAVGRTRARTRASLRKRPNSPARASSTTSNSASDSSTPSSSRAASLASSMVRPVVSTHSTATSVASGWCDGCPSGAVYRYDSAAARPACRSWSACWHRHHYCWPVGAWLRSRVGVSSGRPVPPSTPSSRPRPRLCCQSPSRPVWPAPLAFAVVPWLRPGVPGTGPARPSSPTRRRSSWWWLRRAGCHRRPEAGWTAARRLAATAARRLAEAAATAARRFGGLLPPSLLFIEFMRVGLDLSYLLDHQGLDLGIEAVHGVLLHDAAHVRHGVVQQDAGGEPDEQNNQEQHGRYFISRICGLAGPRWDCGTSSGRTADSPSRPGPTPGSSRAAPPTRSREG